VTVAASASYIDYTSDGAQLVFPIPFVFARASDIRVSKINPVGGAETVLTQGVDYTVTGAGTDGGDVTLTAAVTATWKVRVKRLVELTQTTSLRSQGSFSPVVHEAALDKLTQAVQQINDGEITANNFTNYGTDASTGNVLATGSTTTRPLASRFIDTVNVKDFGATGDGATDDTVAIQAAITAGAGKRVLFPKPSARYKVTATLNIPSSVAIEGAGSQVVELQVPAGSTFPVFDVDGQSRVNITGFKFTKAAGANLAGTAYGVRIRGNASDVRIEHCEADGFVRGFQVAGAEGTVAGTCSRITLRSCVAKNSPSTFGFNVDDTNVLVMDDCHATANWLDGFKLRKKTTNVTLIACSSIGNGVGYLSNPALYAGDGLDAYAGGDTFLITGFVSESNYGNGLTVKTGALTKTDSANYGYVRNAQIIGCRLRSNQSQGLYLTVSDVADLAEPMVNCVSVVGGVYENNGQAGVYVNTRNTSLLGPIARDNQQHGIVTSSRAMDVEIVSPVCIANGRSLAANYDGINIQGTRIRVRGGVYVGADAATVGQDSDLGALTAYQRYAVRVTSTAIDCEVDVAQAPYHTGSQMVRVDMAAGRCITRQSGTGVPISVGVYGSIGSTWVRLGRRPGPEDVFSG
jgi:hypothetical protein